MAEDPGYEYVCENTSGDPHPTWSPNPLTKCVAYVLGHPCPGTLKRVGAGSRTAKATSK